MSTRWVAIDVAIGDNPKVWRFAATLYPSLGRHAELALPAAAGHLTFLFGAMKVSAPDGNVADVPDDLLELWAKWRGKRGAFAAAFRQAFAPDGHVHDWEEWNGRLVRQQERERQRWHERKEREHSAREKAPRSTGDSGGDSADHSTGDSGGDSNGTHPPTYQPTSENHPRGKRAGARPPGEPASRETWLTPAHHAWEAQFGAGSFRAKKAAGILAPLRAAGLSPGDIGARLSRYVAAKRGGFCTLADFAEHHAEYAPPAGPLVVDGWFTPEGERETRPRGVA